MGNRLRQLRELKGWTLEETAKQFGLSRSGFVKLERGERKLTEDYIATAARVFGVAPAEVISDSTVGPAVARSGEAPTFAGYVRAGLFETFDPDFQQDAEPVPDFVQKQPGYGRIRQYAYRARGDSLTEAGIDDGMWIVAADASDFIDQHGEIESGDLVVVERTRLQRGERELTVKEIRFYRDRYELHPKSANPAHKPIVVPHDMSVDADGIEVKIVGVVLTAYRDFRRKRR